MIYTIKFIISGAFNWFKHNFEGRNTYMEMIPFLMWYGKQARNVSYGSPLLGMKVCISELCTLKLMANNLKYYY
jgi:hypothetical protein